MRKVVTTLSLGRVVPTLVQACNKVDICSYDLVDK